MFLSYKKIRRNSIRLANCTRNRDYQYRISALLQSAVTTRAMRRNRNNEMAGSWHCKLLQSTTEGKYLLSQHRQQDCQCLCAELSPSPITGGGDGDRIDSNVIVLTDIVSVLLYNVKLSHCFLLCHPWGSHSNLKFCRNFSSSLAAL